ncbi:MAG: sigma 54-interacting transcriptional regulator [Bacteroidota bacterium]|nr:sigma 54-interacting transcriptional regulator [Bacteroidota bacterium]
MDKNKLIQILIGFVSTSFFIGIILLFPSLFSDLEENVLNSKFSVRGESKIDTSIVILYLDNDDITALGGWPLKRNYYALLINVLNELGSKVIGFGIALTETNQERPEYDDLIANVVQKNNNVVLSGYFKSISNEGPNLTSRLPEGVGYRLDPKNQLLSGEEINLPFEKLLTSTYSVGHENLTADSKVPLFILSGTGLMPAFSFEILRRFLDAEKHKVAIYNSKAIIKTPARSVEIPFNDDAAVNINYPGGVSSLQAIPVVEFLQAYNLSKRGGITDIDVNKIKNKIVLVGVIAQGRSSFLSTPYSKQFPALGVHAAIIHNALHNNFVAKLPKFFEYLFLLLVGTAASVLIFRKNELKSLLILGGIILLYTVLSYLCFLIFNLDVPISGFLFVALFLTFGLLVYKHRIVKRTMYHLESEKDAIAKKLRQREERLLRLENELQEAEQSHATDKTTVLLEKINKYKNELKTLKERVSDLHISVDERAVKVEPQNFEGIIYHPQGPMQPIIEFVKKIADNDAAVLILGESGTGKELIAKAIHKTSKRSNNPFIAVNCGALSETLLESELFGHEKGAFTGAVKEKPGRFELADGGTIFLDEVAETSEAFQVKLLRVLQEGEFERVGGTETQKVNVRVIAATNRDLLSDNSSKKFRQDLYYRLSVFVVTLPPLRQRKSDIPILAEYYVNLEYRGMKISPNILEVFMVYDWPGNIREMHSAIKRSVILAKSENKEIISLSDLPPEMENLRQQNIDIVDRIIESLRDKNFSRSSISDTAKELGGFNRGTVAEYFRGFCFQKFVDKDFNWDETITAISETDDFEIRKKVANKLNEYLTNALELVEQNKDVEENIIRSKPKFKNLQQKYHIYLEKIIERYTKGEFKIHQ